MQEVEPALQPVFEPVRAAVESARIASIVAAAGAAGGWDWPEAVAEAVWALLMTGGEPSGRSGSAIPSAERALRELLRFMAILLGARNTQSSCNRPS